MKGMNGIYSINPALLGGVVAILLEVVTIMLLPL